MTTENDAKTSTRMSLLTRLLLNKKRFLKDRQLLALLLCRRGDSVEDFSDEEWGAITRAFKRLASQRRGMEADKQALKAMGLTLTELLRGRRNFHRQQRLKASAAAQPARPASRAAAGWRATPRTPRSP